MFITIKNCWDFNRTILAKFNSHRHHTFRIVQTDIVKEVLSRSFMLNLTIAGDSIKQKTIVKIDVSHDDILLLTHICRSLLGTNHKELI
jgi:hypothetical protein